MRRAGDNPFRTARIESLGFRGADPEALADQLIEQGRGALVGPHGTGKTTLMEQIGACLAGRGYPVRTLGFHNEAGRTVRLHRGSGAPGDERALYPPGCRVRGPILVDGFDLLGTARRWRLRWQLRDEPVVLVTAHRPTVWPTLHHHQPRHDVAEGLLEELVGADADALSDTLCQRLEAFEGNLRAVWLSLYDDWAAGEIL